VGLSSEYKYGTSGQFLISIGLISVTAFTCFLLADLIGYRVVALLLLMEVSIVAMLFDILPVLISAALSALIWNFFFIPPIFNFYIDTTEDALLFTMYFFIALINAVLTFKIRQYEKQIREKEDRERTIKLYNTLLSSLSHEMRTPIATIIGSIDTIRQNDVAIPEESKNELLTEIQKAGTRLDQQVENLLNMSRLESGNLQLKYDWCDVNELVFRIISEVKDGRNEHTIDFNSDEDLPLFRLDRGLIGQVLYNLLLNALVHTPENTHIQILVKHNDDCCRFVVSDNGPGFPDKEIQRVFDKFYRLPHSRGGGTGLGLSIVKGFVEVHKGRIQLRNRPAGGAEFIIDIPAEHSTLQKETMSIE
jgi:two-component system, OmpR family, sensor histidine kinase KdpD